MLAEESAPQLQDLVTRIRLELQERAALLYSGARPSDLVRMFICQDAIDQVLLGATQVLRELGHDTVTLADVSPEDLIPYWAKRIEALRGLPPREAPHVTDMQHATILDIASGAHAALKQRARNIVFLEEGPPSGFRTRPELASLDKSKTLPLAFVFGGNPRTVLEKEFQKFSSHVQARRRKPGPRAAVACGQLPSDIFGPQYYS